MKSLNFTQKQSIALIQIGNFFEYFDLMLYIHMAPVLNLIFFPVNDVYMAGLLNAFTFSATFLLRPLGAFFFGYLGDNIGRKSTVAITTSLMALSSFLIASLPPYASIGFMASIGLIFFRMLQGLSSVGEVTGAKVYAMEIAKPPYSYYYTALVDVSAGIGGVFALLVCSLLLSTNVEQGWRLVFYLGSGIAVVGSLARTRLKETPEFLEKKKKHRYNNTGFIKNTWHLFPVSSAARKNFFYYLGAECTVPFYMYITYIYLGDILRQQHGFSIADVVQHNLYFSFFEVFITFTYARLTLYFYPLTFIKIRGVLFLVFALTLPWITEACQTSWSIFFIQGLMALLCGGSEPAHAIFMRNLPTIGRYTQAAVIFAFSRTLMSFIVSYGCVYLGDKFGFHGISWLLGFFASVFLYSVFNFKPNKVEESK